MPMTFTMKRVAEELSARGLDGSGTEQEMRERLANHIESAYGDFVEGWEIRTGRPWDTMTKGEAMVLLQLHPQLQRNLGIMSRLMLG